MKFLKLKCKIYFFKHKGRKTPIPNGYKPLIRFDEESDFFFDTRLQLIERDFLSLGEEGEAYLYVKETDKLVSHLKNRATFSLNEPPLQVGEGEIIAILEMD